MRNIKNIIRGISILLIIIFLCGCEKSNIPSKTEDKNAIRIGVSLYSQYDTFISELIHATQEYAKVIEKDKDIAIYFDILSASGNQSIQNDQVEKFIKEDCDIICVNLVDRTDASFIIESAEAANIPIIFFNRELVEEDLERWSKLYYVGADAFESGDIQGDILVEICQKDFDLVDKNGDGIVQYVILEGEAGHQDSLVRTMHVINRITESGIQVEKLADEIANWNREQGYTKMTQWLKTFPSEIEVCIGNNDDMVLGAIDALKHEGYTPGSDNWPIILGIDAIEEGKSAVLNQEMSGTVLNDSKGQARGIVELACWIALNTEFPEDIELLDNKYIRIPYEKVTLETLSD